MNAISKVIESVIETVRIYKLLKYGDSDTINSYRIGAFGEDSVTPAEYKALYIKTSNSEEPVCVGFVNTLVLEDLNQGEKALFSTDETGENIVTKIVQRNTGDIEINQGLDDNGFKAILAADGTVTIESIDQTITIDGALTINTTGNVEVNSDGDVDITAGGNATITATQFDVNGGNLTVD